MFTWICPTCGREVPPAYNECPDCAAKTASDSVTASATPPGAGAPFQQPGAPFQQPGAPSQQGTRSMRRPLWATGPQDPLPPAPPPAYAPPPEEPPSIRPPKQATSPLFQTSAPETPRYTVPQHPGTPKWLLGVATGSTVVAI